MKKKLLSIVVPMYNEESNVAPFFESVIPILEQLTENYEVICVNDGSADKTLELLEAQNRKNPFVKVIDLSRNFGKEAALTAGLNCAKGDAVVPIDADLQDPPDLIPELVEKWRQGYKVVLCRRTDRSSEGFFKRTAAGMFYWLSGKMSDIPIPFNVGDFRLMDRQVVDALKLFPERTRYMKGLFAWLGFDQTCVGYVRPARLEGSTKWNFLLLLNFALDGIFSFSTLPLRVWTYLGGMVAVFAFFYMLFIVFKVLIMGIDVPGYASTLVVILFFSGLNMLGLGILGEYVGRIFAEVKRRPIYIVERTIGLGDYSSESLKGSFPNPWEN